MKTKLLLAAFTLIFLTHSLVFAATPASTNTDAFILPSPGGFQKARAANIAKETIEQCIQNFANYDDLSQAETSIPGLLAIPSSGSFQVLVVTRLARVRRILAFGRLHPDLVLPLLRTKLQNDMSDWPDAFDSKMKRFAEMAKQGKPPTSSKASKFEAITFGAAASTYLVGELGDKEALPLLVDLFKLNTNAPNRYGPVSPALLVGAMREIITRLPESSLNEKSRELRAAFLKEAEDSLQPPRVTTVTTSWNAEWDESDPRLAVVKTGPEALKNQPKMELRIYPDSFKDGKLIGSGDGVASARAVKLFDLADQLVKTMK